MRFVDEATILVRSGKGGNGCASLRREANVPKGGPDGGDGGKGGDVIFRGTNRLMSLYDFRLHRHYFAKNGEGGMGRDRYGKAADDLYVELPVGTLLYEVTEHEDGTTSEKLIADLVEDGTEVVICEGGKGGRGTCISSRPPTALPYAEPVSSEESGFALNSRFLPTWGCSVCPVPEIHIYFESSAARPKSRPTPYHACSQSRRY